MGANDTQSGAIFDPKSIIGRIIKGTSSHCYTQTIEALGVLSEKTFFFYMFFLL